MRIVEKHASSETEAYWKAANEFCKHRIDVLRKAAEAIWNVKTDREIECFMAGAEAAASLIIMDMKQGKVEFKFIEIEHNNPNERK